MCQVKVFNDDIAGALRVLKKKMDREGVLAECREREYYKKPSTKRRQKRLAAIARSRKRQRGRR